MNEYWSLRRGARAAAADAARVLRAAAAGRRSRRARAEAPLAGPDLRRRGLPHARRRRVLRRARARDQHQAREVGRHPRGGADGPRGAGARARRHARLHGRVRPRRSPPAPRSRASATTSTSTATCSSPRIRGRASSSSTASRFPPTGPGSVSRPRRLLILAEGYSADPHYGKTARGVIRYRPEQVVAVLDSQRAGETQDGFPVVATVEEALAARADDGARRRRDAGRPVPAGLARAPEDRDRARARHRERPARVHLRRPGARRSSPPGTASSCATCASRRPA